jgi:hypothetical protein
VHDVLAAFLPEVKAANIKVEDTYENKFRRGGAEEVARQDVKLAAFKRPARLFPNGVENPARAPADALC